MACENCQPCETQLCEPKRIKCVYSCGCCCHIPVVPGANINALAGTIMAEKTSDKKWYPYDPNATDGTQYPRGVLEYDLVTDSSGDVQVNGYGHTMFGPHCPPNYINVYICGTFRTEETSGNLAAALANPGFGRLITGTATGPGIWKLL